MSFWRLDIAYDGRDFRGWAKQPGQRTVQGELERALAVALRREVALTVAGRTDAGVHAWGQVASFEPVEPAPGGGSGSAASPGQPGELAAGDSRDAPPSPERLRRSLNALTPPDIAITAVSASKDPFDARRDAKARRYCYRLYTGSAMSPFEWGRALWWPYTIERERLDACAQALLGQHDFTAFTPTRTDHVYFSREIFEARWAEAAAHGPGAILEFWVEADAFMRSMVRTLVGTMLEVAGGRRTVAEFEALLVGRPRVEAGETAPPHGLYLASVRY